MGRCRDLLVLWCPRQAASVSSLAYWTCHLPVWMVHIFLPSLLAFCARGPVCKPILVRYRKQCFRLLVPQALGLEIPNLITVKEWRRKLTANLKYLVHFACEVPIVLSIIQEHYLNALEVNRERDFQNDSMSELFSWGSHICHNNSFTLLQPNKGALFSY